MLGGIYLDFFSEILGQERAIQHLKNSIFNNSLSHAYIFFGPTGTGKVTTSLAMAYELIAASDEHAMTYLKEKVHPDLLIIEKAENKTVITKEQISADLIPWLALKPYRAKQKIVIIKDSHYMSEQASNALLKTLEEAPPYALIILTADEKHIMETIVSRCQMVRFYPLVDKDIEQYLQKEGIEKDRAYRLAKMAQGNLEMAIKFSEQDNDKLIWEEIQQILLKLAKGNEYSVFECAELIEKNPLFFLSILESILRDIYIFILSGKKELMLLPESEEMIKQIENLNEEGLKVALENISHLKRHYQDNTSSNLLSINIFYFIRDSFK